MMFPESVRFLSSETAEAGQLSIVPYSEVNGARTLSDEFVRSLAERCRDEDTLDQVFYDGCVITDEDFIHLLKMPSNSVVFVFRGHEPIGFAWLNDFASNYAFAHFCAFGSRGEDAQKAARMVIDYWMAFLRPDGDPLLDLILGVIPEWNARALRFVERIGFVRSGRIPKMIPDDGEKVAGVIVYYVRP